MTGQCLSRAVLYRGDQRAVALTKTNSLVVGDNPTHGGAIETDYSIPPDTLQELLDAIAHGDRAEQESIIAYIQREVIER